MILNRESTRMDANPGKPGEGLPLVIVLLLLLVLGAKRPPKIRLLFAPLGLYNNPLICMNERLLCFLIALGLAGCATHPENQSTQLDLEVPPQYTAQTNASSDPSIGWLADFDDPALTQLVLEAQERNFDLQAAAARLRVAQGNVTLAGANRLPALSVNASGSRTKRIATGGFQLTSSRSDRFDLGGTFLWEADLWGRYLNQHKAAVADYEATEADHHAAQLSLAANTAKAWFNAIETSLQFQLAHDTVQSFERNLTVVEASYGRGVTSALDVHLSRANVAAARSNLDFRQRQRDAAVRSLEVILGRYPADRLELASELPALRRPVPTGLPSELLQRRPDLVSAERQLAADHERLKASRKSLLPSISLTASGGTTTDELKDLLDTRNLIWNLAANLTQPLFQGGRIMANIDITKAREDESLANYAQLVLQAFREVETSLAAEELLASQEISLLLAAEESQAAEDLAWEEYQRGLNDIITVLESQRRAFNARSSLIELNNQRLQNRLDLYLALGGDFDSPSLSAQADPEHP